ncbi:MAG: GNAT family N-acetyltransferase [Rhodoferax sp.]|nr:GNAT family N-acetyltransferase [Rhodoferax sp.]
MHNSLNSIGRLKKLFPLQRATPLSVRLAAHPEERAALIALRTHTYRQVGKHQKEELMTDQFDADALLVGVWQGEEPIASARVIWRKPDDEWEHDRFVEWSDIFPPRENCVEISRFCVTEKARSWAAIRALCTGILEALCRTGKAEFVACCTDEFVPLYRQFFGAQMLGQPFIHSDLGPKPHYMFRCDYRSCSVCRGITFIPWLVLWPSGTRSFMRQYPHMFPDVTNAQRALLLAGAIVEPFAAYVFGVWRQGRKKR